jgi:hypothetical protein
MAEVADELWIMAQRQAGANPELSRQLEAMALVVRAQVNDQDPLTRYIALHGLTQRCETTLSDVDATLKRLHPEGGASGPRTAFDWNRFFEYREVRWALVGAVVCLLLWIVGTFAIEVSTPDGYRAGPPVGSEPIEPNEGNQDQDDPAPNAAPPPVILNRSEGSRMPQPLLTLTVPI